MRTARVLMILLILVSAMAAAQQRRFQPNPKLYDTSADAKKEVTEALHAAKTDHKNVMLVFGGNWCLDCHVLDYWFHDPAIEPLVEAGYHVVHIDIGQYDKNLDLPEKYGTTIKKGVPAISVLSPAGKVLFGDTTGEFEKARSIDPKDIRAFVVQWSPTRK